MLFAAIQPLHSFAESKIFNPAFFFVFFVTDLVHDIECVTAIGVDRVIKTERTLDGIEGENDVLFRNAGFGGNFVESRLFVLRL